MNESERCPSTFWWSSEALRTHCQRDLGHYGTHLELKGVTLYKWNDTNPERNLIIPQQRIAS